MRVAYIGNFEPEHSTENHVKTALQNNGHIVIPHQENNLESWDKVDPAECDFVLWTRTGWNPRIPDAKQFGMMERVRAAGKSVIGYHLDRWWGLKRSYEVAREPFFKSDLVVTADGDPNHQLLFQGENVNHVWFPPGVSRNECLRTPREAPQYKHEVVFVGSHLDYHPEWRYRMQLVRFLNTKFGNRVKMYPEPGQHALRGQPLVDLYANAKVIVGDSCLNDGITHYWSDRIPETLGRHGFLIHPNVEGLKDYFEPGKHLVTYDLGDWPTLESLIEEYVKADLVREEISGAGKQHVLEHHTYEVRMDQLINLLDERDFL